MESGGKAGLRPPRLEGLGERAIPAHRRKGRRPLPVFLRESREAPEGRAMEGARHGSGALDRLEHLEGGGVLGDVMDAENGGASRERHEVGCERADQPVVNVGVG